MDRDKADRSNQTSRYFQFTNPCDTLIMNMISSILLIIATMVSCWLIPPLRPVFVLSATILVVVLMVSRLPKTCSRLSGFLIQIRDHGWIFPALLGMVAPGIIGIALMIVTLTWSFTVGAWVDKTWPHLRRV